MDIRAVNVVPTVHATRDLTSLLVAPADRRKVCLVVHKATVKEWLDIGVGGLDVDLSATRRVFLDIEMLNKHCPNHEEDNPQGIGTW